MKISNLHAIGLAITGYTLWVFSDICMKLAGNASLPFYMVIGFLGFFSVILLLGWHATRGDIRKLKPKNVRHQTGRALMCIFTNCMNVVALKHLPLTLFYVTVFTAPMLIAILAVLYGHEKLKLNKVLAIIAGFIGVVIAINPSHDLSNGDWIGYVAASAGTLCWAFNVTWLRVMTKTENNASIIFFTAVSEMVFGFALIPFGHSPSLTYDLILFLFGMSAFCVLGNIAVYRALKYTTSTNVSQFHYTQIIMGAFFGYLLWKEMPTLHLWLGVAVIVSAGLYIIHHAHKAEANASSV